MDHAPAQVMLRRATPRGPRKRLFRRPSWRFVG